MATTISMPLVESSIRQRVDTDRQMSFGGFIVWYIVLAIFTLGIGSLVYSYITIYRLVERRNMHFERQHRLLTSAIRCLREHAESTGPQSQAAAIDRAEAMVQDGHLREPEKNAWLWAVILPIVTLGIAGFWTYFFLTSDYRAHSLRQREVSDVLSEAIRGATGRNVSLVDEAVVPERNCWIYLLLTIASVGLFGIYWGYVMFDDPNKHFAREAFWEDQLVAHLRAL